MKTWVLCWRHPDYGNEYDTIEGDEIGVEIMTVDTGAEFESGTPSRAWCAERYFNADDVPTSVKRVLLDGLKLLASDEKEPREVTT